MESKIIQGNSLEVLKTFPDKSFDLVLTDPPYDIGEELKQIYHDEMMRIAKSLIVFMSPENQWLPPDQYGFWIKPISTKNTSRRYSRFVEMIFFYGELKWNADRHWSQYTNVFADLVEGETEHPFEKPMSLIKRLILNHSNTGETILDPLLGSGTTLVACKQLNRNGVGIEISPEYVEIARRRLEQQTLL